MSNIEFLKSNIANGLYSLSGHLGLVNQIVTVDANGKVDKTLDQLLEEYNGYVKNLGTFSSTTEGDAAAALAENAGNENITLMLYDVPNIGRHYIYNYVDSTTCIQVKKDGIYQESTKFLSRIIWFRDSNRSEVSSVYSWEASYPLSLSQTRLSNLDYLTNNALKSGSAGPKINNTSLSNGTNVSIAAVDGSTLTITPTLNTGTEIGRFVLDGTTSIFYAPEAQLSDNYLKLNNATEQLVNSDVRFNSDVILDDLVKAYGNIALDGALLLIGGNNSYSSVVKTGTLDNNASLIFGQNEEVQNVVISAENVYTTNSSADSINSSAIGVAVKKVLTDGDLSFKYFLSTGLSNDISLVMPQNAQYGKLQLYVSNNKSITCYIHAANDSGPGLMPSTHFTKVLAMPQFSILDNKPKLNSLIADSFTATGITINHIDLGEDPLHIDFKNLLYNNSNTPTLYFTPDDSENNVYGNTLFASTAVGFTDHVITEYEDAASSNAVHYFLYDTNYSGQIKSGSSSPTDLPSTAPSTGDYVKLSLATTAANPAHTTTELSVYIPVATSSKSGLMPRAAISDINNLKLADNEFTAQINTLTNKIAALEAKVTQLEEIIEGLSPTQGTVTKVTMNGKEFTPTNGVVNIGTVVTLVQKNGTSITGTPSSTTGTCVANVNNVLTSVTYTSSPSDTAVTKNVSNNTVNLGTIATGNMNDYVTKTNFNNAFTYTAAQGSTPATLAISKLS